MDAQRTQIDAFFSGAPAGIENYSSLAEYRQNASIQNALLRTDEWEELDQAVLRVMKERLTILDDLRNAGLTRPLGGLGTIYSAYDQLDDMTAAERSMDGVTQSEQDRNEFTKKIVPVPITHKGFRINRRTLLASRREPMANLDTTQSETATRLVRDSLNDLVFNGSNIVVSGNAIYGLTTHPQRNTVTLSTPWDDDGADPIEDTVSMLEAQYADNSFGPFNLYVPKNWWAAIQEDYSDNKGDRTYMERIEAFEDINAVRPGDQLADDNAVLVQMTSDVLDLAVAEDIMTIQWDSGDTMTAHFKVMAAMAPRIKSDAEDKSGVCHLS